MARAMGRSNRIFVNICLTMARFVEFQSSDALRRAANTLEGREMKGRIIHCTSEVS